MVTFLIILGVVVGIAVPILYISSGADGIWGFRALTFILILNCLWFSIFCMYQSYKEGQIDAINGDISYELRENEIGETTWVKIKEEK